MKKRVWLLSVLFLIILNSSCKSTSEIQKNEEVKLLYHKELSKPKKNNDYYIFIRLYYPKYNNPFCIENILKKCINIVDTNQKSYSHSAIGFDLNDNFVGLTTAKPRDLKIEQCTNIYSNLYMNKCNPKTSIQTTYAIKVSKDEYEKARSLVDFFYYEDTEYSVGLNFPLAFFELKRKFFTSRENKKLHRIGKEKYKNSYKKPSTDFVCSSFVTYILVNSVDAIKTFFDTNNLDYNYIIPSDISSFPGVQKLFTSSWQSYTNAALAYTNSENNIFNTNK